MTEHPAVLLDTCAAIWLAHDQPMDAHAKADIVRAGNAGGIHVSVATAWEIGLLARRASASGLRLQFLPDAKSWFQRLLSGPGLRLAPLTPAIAIDASHLPGELHADPADRMIVATARHLGIPVVTRDRKIIAYANEGHARVIRC